MKKSKSYLSFKLGNELFAVSVKKVLEVMQQKKLTIVPNTPEYIEGVINFRGEIIPVAELRKKLNMPLRKPDQKYILIILDMNIGNFQTKLGAIADGVTDVVSISKKEIKEVPEMGSTFDSKFLKGMIERNSEFTMLLDIDKIFTEDEINIDTEQ